MSNVVGNISNHLYSVVASIILLRLEISYNSNFKNVTGNSQYWNKRVSFLFDL